MTNIRTDWTRDEIAAFRRLFHVPVDELKNVGRVFDLARKDSRGFEPYARQVARMFASNPAVLEELLDALFYIAKADGVIHPAEFDYLAGAAGLAISAPAAMPEARKLEILRLATLLP